MPVFFAFWRPVLCLVLLSSTTVLALTHDAAAAGCALAAALILLLPFLKTVAGSTTGKFALAQGAAAAIITFSRADALNGAALVSGTRFIGVAAFLICMPLYAQIFRAAGLDRLMIAAFTRVSPRFRVPALLTCAVASAFGLSFGTIPVYGNAMPPRCRPATAALARGVVISMLLAPTTGSVAAVMAAFPTLTLPQILVATVPLAAIAFGLACLFHHGAIDMTKTEPSGGSPNLSPLPMVVCLGATLTLVGVPLLPTIAWTAVGLHLLWHLPRTGWRGGWSTLAQRFDDAAGRLAPEILLFVATGWLAWALGSMPMPFLDGMASWLPTLRIGLPALILLVMAALAVAGVHPMVVFSLLQPLVDKVGTGLPVVGEYAIWLVGIILSMLVAPVSVLTAISATTAGLSTWQASVRLHGGYAAALAAATILYIALRF